MEDGLQDNVWMDVNSGRSPIESVSGPYKKRDLTKKVRKDSRGTISS